MYRIEMLEHHTKTKGDLGVIAAEFDLVQRGLHVLIPRTEHAPFDLVAYDGSVFYRIQVKYRTAKRGVLSVQLSSFWADRHGVHKVRVDKKSIDVVCIYSPETKLCYYVDPNDFNCGVELRIHATRNAQSKGVTFAKDFVEFPPAPRSRLRVVD